MDCKIKVSDSNVKLGKIMNFSLNPVETCNKNVPCIKHCYARASFDIYPQTKIAWNSNTVMVKNNVYLFFNSLVDQLEKYKGEYFRYHVGGDIPSEVYFKCMVKVARMFPKIKFLAFTKQYDYVNSYTGKIPINLSIVFSVWKDYKPNVNKHKLPIAFMNVGNENSIDCKGSCKDCKVCWNMKENESVIFKIHGRGFHNRKTK